LISSIRAESSLHLASVVVETSRISAGLSPIN
jgi:hypothetical protein